MHYLATYLHIRLKEGQNPIYGWLKKCPFGQVIFVMLTKEKKTDHRLPASRKVQYTWS